MHVLYPPPKIPLYVNLLGLICLLRERRRLKESRKRYETRRFSTHVLCLQKRPKRVRYHLFSGPFDSKPGTKGRDTKILSKLSLTRPKVSGDLPPQRDIVHRGVFCLGYRQLCFDPDRGHE